MKIPPTLLLLAAWTVWGAGAQAQTTADAERLRIGTERAKLEASFTLEDTACYKKFLVNNCLGEVKIRRRETLADLRRQEISLDDQERKIKGAEQIQKTEDKASPEKQQQEADRRAEALKEYEARLEREKQKNADRATAQANEKANEKTNADASAGRAKSSQDKAGARAIRQAATTEEVKKYSERLEKAKERQARYARDQASQTKPASKPLPTQE